MDTNHKILHNLARWLTWQRDSMSITLFDKKQGQVWNYINSKSSWIHIDDYNNKIYSSYQVDDENSTINFNKCADCAVCDNIIVILKIVIIKLQSEFNIVGICKNCVIKIDALRKEYSDSISCALISHVIKTYACSDVTPYIIQHIPIPARIHGVTVSKWCILS